MAQVGRIASRTGGSDMRLRVQEISVDGSHIHDQRFDDLAAAQLFADRIVAHCSELLVRVDVLRDDMGPDWRRIRTVDARSKSWSLF